MNNNTPHSCPTHDNEFLMQFTGAAQQLSRELNLPQIVLNKDHCCKLMYNNEFLIDIFGLSTGGLQLHAYIAPIYENETNHNLCRALLEANTTHKELSGCYLGINPIMKSVSLNAVIPMSSIDAHSLMTILHNFITKAKSEKQVIESMIQSVPPINNNHSTDRTLIDNNQTEATSMTTEHLMMLGHRA